MLDPIEGSQVDHCLSWFSLFLFVEKKSIMRRGGILGVTSFYLLFAGWRADIVEELLLGF
jgi:hypothetical protein